VLLNSRLYSFVIDTGGHGGVGSEVPVGPQAKNKIDTVKSKINLCRRFNEGDGIVCFITLFFGYIIRLKE
jgi:hypothetical protein